MSHFLFEVLLLKQVILHLSNAQSFHTHAFSSSAATTMWLRNVIGCICHNLSFFLECLLPVVISFLPFNKPSASFSTSLKLSLVAFVHYLVNFKALNELADPCEVSECEESFTSNVK